MTTHLNQCVDRCSRGKFTRTESPKLEAPDEEPAPDRFEEDHAA